MTWTCDLGDLCREALIDPFDGEYLGPQPPRLIWPDRTCPCGKRLEGIYRRVGRCEECAEWFGEE